MALREVNSAMEKQVRELEERKSTRRVPSGCTPSELREIIGEKKRALAWHREAMNWEEREIKHLAAELLELERKKIPVRIFTFSEAEREKERLRIARRFAAMTPEELQAELKRLQGGQG